MNAGVGMFAGTTLASGAGGVGSAASTTGLLSTAAGAGVEEEAGTGAGGCFFGEAMAGGGMSPSWPDTALWV